MDKSYSSALMEKHMNSKLFQKFLNTMPSKRLGKSLSPRREASPKPVIRKSEEPVKQQALKPDIDQVIKNHYEEELRYQAQEFKMSSEKMYRVHLAEMNEKSAEIARLQKEIDRLTNKCKDFEYKAGQNEEHDRKVRQLKQERSQFDLENQELHELNRHLRRQLDLAKVDMENARNTHDESERTTKTKVFELERELRGCKDEIESLDRQLAFFKNREANLQRKLHEKKQKISRLGEELSRTNAKVNKMEMERPAEMNRYREDNRPQYEYEEFAPPARHSLEYRTSPERDTLRNKIGTNNSDNMLNALRWNETEAKATKGDPASIKNFETKLYQLSMEKRTLENEYARLPEHPKKASAIHRREELEGLLNAMNHRISTVKANLRQLGALPKK